MFTVCFHLCINQYTCDVNEYSNVNVVLLHTEYCMLHCSWLHESEALLLVQQTLLSLHAGGGT